MNAGFHHLLEARVFCKRWKDPEQRMFGGRGE